MYMIYMYMIYMYIYIYTYIHVYTLFVCIMYPFVSNMFHDFSVVNSPFPYHFPRRPSPALTEEPRTAISPGTTPRRVTKCIAMRTDMDNTDMPEAQRGAGG